MALQPDQESLGSLADHNQQNMVQKSLLNFQDFQAAAETNVNNEKTSLENSIGYLCTSS